MTYKVHMSYTLVACTCGIPSMYLKTIDIIICIRFINKYIAMYEAWLTLLSNCHYFKIHY